MLASLRNEANLSWSELSNRTGLKENTLQSLESGRFFKREVINLVLNTLGYRLSFTPVKIKETASLNHISNQLSDFIKNGFNDFDISVITHSIQCHDTEYAEHYDCIFHNSVTKDFLVGDSLKLFNDACHSVPFPKPLKYNFSFIDLFAGIGGFRLAMESVGGKCVFSSEWDKAAQNTYYDNYGEYPFGDITSPDIKKCIPDHFDVLCAGFPCQPFSLAGKKQGFLNETQGTLFFDILQIIRDKKPSVIFLENVRNIVGHDNGKTFSVIQNAIKDEGYSFHYRLIDASPLVPQKRIRCYMVCVKDNAPFTFPEINGPELPLSSVLEDNVPDSYTLTDKLWEGHQLRTQRNLARGTGFTAFTADISKPAHTLVARYYKDGKECLIPQTGKNPRMLTPRECARLQGFPENFILPVSKTVAYKQMGNSVAVPVLKIIAQEIVNQFNFK